VVATAAGGIGSVVRNNETGALVPEKDPASLAAAITSLLGDRELAGRLARSARADVEARHGWDATAARFEAAYERALAFNSLTR
jgi:glycosyltransferase involved in cell wall biosynthesis